MNLIVDWVRKLAVFLILANYMTYLLPKEYRRYFRMCTGLILVLMILAPVMQLFGEQGSGELAYLIENLKTGSGVYAYEETAESGFKDYYMQQYQAALQARIEQLGESCGLVVRSVSMSINSDMDSELYGGITSVNLVIAQSEDVISKRTTLMQLLQTDLDIDASNIHIRQ